MRKHHSHGLVSLPLAAGQSGQTFALVPVTNTQIAEALRRMAKHDKAHARRTEAGPHTDFGVNSGEEQLQEQVEQIFSFRVEPEDVSVKPEVWTKIVRTLPENFVIPDPELTSFFDNLNIMLAEEKTP